MKEQKTSRIDLSDADLRQINEDFLSMGYNGDYVSGQIVGEVVVLQYMRDGKLCQAQYDACITSRHREQQKES